MYFLTNLVVQMLSEIKKGLRAKSTVPSSETEKLLRVVGASMELLADRPSEKILVKVLSDP